MGRAGRTVYPTARYRRERTAVLAGSPLCVHCHVRPAVEADHQPPLSCHAHVPGTGCCQLVPSCFRCGRRQGALLVNGYRPRKRVTTVAAVTSTPVDSEPGGFDVADQVWDRPWIDPLRDVPADAVWPRLMSAPHPAAVGSYGADVAAFAATRGAMGEPLRWWQRLWLARLLEHDDTGALVWREALVSLARQLGKSWVLRELALWRIHQGDRWGRGQDVVHTGKDLGICRQIQRPAWTWAHNHNTATHKAYKVRLVNGQEEIERLADGSRWMLRAKTALNGLTASLAIVDEAWDVAPGPVEEDLAPTLVARRSSQLLLISTAHRKATPLMLDRRAAAVADLTGDRRLLLEWSAPGGVDLDDRDAWRLASPHWDGEREDWIVDRLATARAGQSDDPDEPDPLEAFSAQWLNVWPSTALRPGKGGPLVSTEAWDASEGTLAVTGPGWVALENNATARGVEAAVAFVVSDGKRFEVDGLALDNWDAALTKAKRFVAARPGTRVVVGATLSSTVKAEWRGQEFRTASHGEASTGWALLRSLVDAGRIVHDGTADLDHQISRARVSPLPAGGMKLDSFYNRHDLLKATIWALQAAYAPDPVPAVHG